MIITIPPQVESWLSAKEEFLHKGELGEKPDEVTSLISKHETFEHVSET